MWDVIFFMLRACYSLRWQAPASLCLNDRRPHSNRNKSLHPKVSSRKVGQLQFSLRVSGHSLALLLAPESRQVLGTNALCSPVISGAGAGCHCREVLRSGCLNPLSRRDTLLIRRGSETSPLSASFLHAKCCAGADWESKSRSGGGRVAWFSGVFCPDRWL